MTPLAGELKRHEMNKEQWRNSRGIHDLGTGAGVCMLRPDEREFGTGAMMNDL